MSNVDQRRVAYFTMEVALDNALPTFSGGLGVLAGDYLRSAADQELSVVAVSLLYRGGYFRQHLDETGHQSDAPVSWDPAAMLTRVPDCRTSVQIGSRSVVVTAWRYDVVGETGWQVPVLFLDTDVPENEGTDRSITDQLYSGDEKHRLEQEAVLGIGGVDLVRSLGYEPSTYHMNEGHSALLTLRLFELETESSSFEGDAEKVLQVVREKCVFTTHTPVAAGHDRFKAALVKDVLGPRRVSTLSKIGVVGELDMTDLGARSSHYVNAVSRRHQQVAQEMMPEVEVSSVTNGVHVATWASRSMAKLFDTYVPGWRRDSSLLRYSVGIPLGELAGAHATAKADLLAAVRERTGETLDPAALTIGLARRVTTYKQTTLLFTDLDRLRALAGDIGPLQVVCSGKAHPRDEAGKEIIEQLMEAAQALSGDVPVVFVENYDLSVAALLCSGADVWLNTPAKPQEASGTSGMKAALNGVPSLSVLDGWWIEGCIEGVTGWAIGTLESEKDTAADLYSKLASSVMPTYYEHPEEMLAIRRYAVALNGSFFATDRVAREYAQAAYGL